MVGRREGGSIEAREAAWATEGAIQEQAEGMHPGLPVAWRVKEGAWQQQGVESQLPAQPKLRQC